MPTYTVRVGYKQDAGDKLFRDLPRANAYTPIKSANINTDDAIIPKVPSTLPAPYYEWEINPPGDPLNPNNYDYSDRWAPIGGAPFPIVGTNLWRFPHSETGDPNTKYAIRTNYSVLDANGGWSITTTIRHNVQWYDPAYDNNQYLCRFSYDADVLPSQFFPAASCGGGIDEEGCMPGQYCCAGNCQTAPCGGGGGSGGGGGGTNQGGSCSIWTNRDPNTIGVAAHRLFVGVADATDKLAIYATITHEYYSTTESNTVYVGVKRFVTLNVPGAAATFPIPNNAADTTIVIDYTPQGAQYTIRVLGRDGQSLTYSRNQSFHSWYGIISRHANVNPNLVVGRTDLPWSNGNRLPDYEVTLITADFAAPNDAVFQVGFNATNPYYLKFADHPAIDRRRPPYVLFGDGETAKCVLDTSNFWVSPTINGASTLSVHLRYPMELLTITQEVQAASEERTGTKEIFSAWLHGLLMDQRGGVSIGRVWIRTEPEPLLQTSGSYAVMSNDPVWGTARRYYPPRSARYLIVEASQAMIGRIGSTGEFRIETVAYGGTPYPKAGYPIVIRTNYHQLLWVGLTPTTPPGSTIYMPVPDLVTNTIRFYQYNGTTNQWSEVAENTVVPKTEYVQLAVIKVI